MSRCPSCGEPPFDGSSSADFSNTTANEDDATNEDDSMVTVARFANAAEAGYFAEELSHHGGLSTRLRSDKTFNAVSGYWSQRFDLLVPQTDVREAESILRQLIDQTGGSETLSEEHATDSESPSDELLSDESPRPNERFETETAWPAHSPKKIRVHWSLLLLTVTAGTVAFWAARRIHRQAGVARPAAPAAPAEVPATNLWEKLRVSPQPWRQQLPNGRGVRELHFDTTGQRAVLREDADGDGLFEHEEHLKRPRPH